MNALITGHKGFIGRTLNTLLEAEGWDVEGIDLKDARDVTTPGYLDEFKVPDVIFHLAAHPVTVSPNTVDATYSVVEFAKHTGAHLVFASSAAVFNAFSSVYAAQKVLCETLIQDKLKDYTILRLFNVIGRDGNGVVDKYIRDYCQDKELYINGNGEQRRDFVHVNDVVNAMYMAAQLRKFGTFDIGTGKTSSINDLMQHFPGAKAVYVNKSPGTWGSPAILDVDFPWHPNESNLEDYIELEIKQLKGE